MNVKFAIDCLQNNEWDVDRAFTNFEQVKVRCYLFILLLSFKFLTLLVFRRPWATRRSYNY